MRRLLVLFLLSGCCTTALAESVIVSVRQGEDEAKGTAVAIHTTARGSILLTAKHVVESDPDSVWVLAKGRWNKCHHVLIHPTVDIAVMECEAQLSATSLADIVPEGAEVIVDGAGPEIAGTDEDWYFPGVVKSGEIHNSIGLAIIPGDSGGPVYIRNSTGKYSIGGIVHSCVGNRPAGRRRAEHRGHNAVTLYTPCSAFIPWIQSQYCPSGNCPNQIQIRPVVVQPRGLLGVPYGPPRVIGVAEPVPQQYVPVPPPQLQPVPDPISITGPPGPPGQSVTQEQVEATVNAWLDSNIDRIRGPKGDAGKDGSTADIAKVELRIKTLEERPTRVIWADALTRKKLDDITYKPGEPVVLWLPRTLQVSK